MMLGTYFDVFWIPCSSAYKGLCCERLAVPSPLSGRATRAAETTLAHSDPWEQPSWTGRGKWVCRDR